MRRDARPNRTPNGVDVRPHNVATYLACALDGTETRNEMQSHVDASRHAGMTY